MNWMMLLDRLKEPSTYAGIAAIGLLYGAPRENAEAVATVITAGASVAAIFLSENKKKEVQYDRGEP